MRSVGQILRQARLDQGLETVDVALRLKIHVKYLHSIENDELSNLPGLFFYRSFVQQYARALGIDATEIDQQLNQVVGSRPEPPLPGQDGLPVAARRPSYGSGDLAPRRSLAYSLGRLAVVLVACTGIYAIWSNWSQVRFAATSLTGRFLDNRIDPPPVPVFRTAVGAQASAPAAVATPPPAPTGDTSTPELAPGAGHLVLRLTATEPTWVSVVADGKTVYNGILQPSESRSIDGKTARLVTGNAGGLNVEFNGKSIGAVGDRGQVRTVTFSPDRFEFNPAQPATPAPVARAL